MFLIFILVVILMVLVIILVFYFSNSSISFSIDSNTSITNSSIHFKNLPPVSEAGDLGYFWSKFGVRQDWDEFRLPGYVWVLLQHP